MTLKDAVKTNCKFCNTSIEVRERYENCSQVCDCPVCGKYNLTEEAFELQLKCDQSDKILFSGVLRNRPESERHTLIKSDTLSRISEIVAQYRLFSVTDKIDNLIRYIGRNSKFLKDRVIINKIYDYSKFYCYNQTELVSMLEYLRNRNFIIGEEPDDIIRSSLTVDGWKEYERLKEVNLSSKQAFVAMNFDKEFNDIYDRAIDLACDACGFKAHRVDKIEHNEKICDKIISEIRKSRFVIADFTGQKHGVYFEAGYAQGIGLPVIFLCRKDEIDGKKVHFDTRQYNYIAWESIEDLKKRLSERIKATINNK